MSGRVVVNRELFLTPKSRTVVDVPLPELGNGTVVPVVGMSAKEWTAFQAEQTGKDGKPNAKAKRVRERLVVACCRDDNGGPIFTADDVEAIGAVSAGVIERIVNAALQASGITDADVEALEKN